jgi:hypothetical protein
MNNTSTKVLPYVYKLTHKLTGHFYFGYRFANKVPSSSDLGIKYFTSGKYTKTNFSNFDFLILAEFFNSLDAFNFEQELIFENRKNILILNRRYQKSGTKQFIRFGPLSPESLKKRAETLKNKSLEEKLKMKLKASLSQLGKTRSEESKIKQSKTITGNKRAPHSAETRIKISKSHTGIKLSEAIKRDAYSPEKIKTRVNNFKKNKIMGLHKTPKAPSQSYRTAEYYEKQLITRRANAILNKAD